MAKYKAPKIARKEILGFFGGDKRAARDEMYRLAELLCNTNSTGRMGVKAEMQRGEWVVMVTHYAEPEIDDSVEVAVPGKLAWTSRTA